MDYKQRILDLQEQQKVAAKQIDANIKQMDNVFAATINNVDLESRKKLSNLQLEVKKLIAQAQQGKDVSKDLANLKKQFDGSNNNK